MQPDQQQQTLLRRVLVYADRGADARCVSMATAFFRALLPSDSFAVETILAPALLAGDWATDKTAALVMPGGADLGYVALLSGAGNAVITSFVRDQGGVYVGFCAGAYYASQSILFDGGGPLQVAGARELAFYPGCAVGPVFPGFQYAGFGGSRAAGIRVPETMEETRVYFNGGCRFEANTAATAATTTAASSCVLAVYTDPEGSEQPAVVYVPVGRGHALLSGVHFEYDVSLLPAGLDFPADVFSALAATHSRNVTLFASWFLPLLATQPRVS